LKLSYNYYWDKDYENWEDARDAGKLIVSSWLNRVRCDDMLCSGIVSAINSSDGTVSSFLEELISASAAQCSSELATQVQEGIEGLIWNFDVRSTGCVLEKTEDGGETWVPFADVSTCGAVGPQGPQGIQGETGEQGSQGIQGLQGVQGIQGVQGEPGISGTTSEPAPEPPGDDGQAKRCNVARGVTQWSIEKFSDALDAFQATYQVVAAVEVAVSGMIDAVPVVGAFIDAAMDFGREIVEWDIVNLKACITEEWEDEIYCKLYCLLGEDGVITDEIFNEFLTEVALMPPCSIAVTLVSQVYALAMLAVGAQNFRNRAYIFASLETTCISCDDCPDCENFNAPATSGTAGFDTGIDIASGQEITITATGTWKYGLSAPEECDADGLPGTAPGDWMLTTAQAQALIGKIGSGGSWFDIGTSYTGTPGAGRLYVTMNEWTGGSGAEANFGDNSGSLSVELCFS
jgi:hypothetical protein